MAKKSRDFVSTVEAAVAEAIAKRPFVVSVKEIAAQVALEFPRRQTALEDMIKEQLQARGIFWRDE